MRSLGVVVALAIVIVVLVDAFEAVVLPRRVKHNFRLARVYFQSMWCLWRAGSRLLPMGRWRFGYLSVFGPLSLFGLLIVWATGLIFGFALIHLSLRTAILQAHDKGGVFSTYLYLSGTTFFTLGYGDIVPVGGIGRALSVVEAGLGFGFLAIVISYVPVLYQTFSRREITISLLDARAGSPPTAGELLKRLAEAKRLTAVHGLLIEWERWSAELLESHLSFPVVSYYRSQHDNQSWVATLTMILDTSALLLSVVDGPDDYQARLTFAMARHAAVDLGLVYGRPLVPPDEDRLSPDKLGRFLEVLRLSRVQVSNGSREVSSLADLRRLYEPFVNSLADYFELPLPPFLPTGTPVDNWQTSPWMGCAPRLSELPGDDADERSPHDNFH